MWRVVWHLLPLSHFTGFARIRKETTCASRNGSGSAAPQHEDDTIQIAEENKVVLVSPLTV